MNPMIYLRTLSQWLTTDITDIVDIVDIADWTHSTNARLICVSLIDQTQSTPDIGSKANAITTFWLIIIGLIIND